jgi:hypothetical protein
MVPLSQGHPKALGKPIGKPIRKLSGKPRSRSPGLRSLCSLIAFGSTSNSNSQCDGKGKEVNPKVTCGWSGSLSLAYRQRSVALGEGRSERVEKRDKVRAVIPSWMCRNPVRSELMMTIGNPILQMSVIQDPAQRGMYKPSSESLPAQLWWRRSITYL